MSKQPQILFIVPYPLNRAPSQRFRVELFLPFLEKQGVRYRIAPFLDDKTFSILYSKAGNLHKASGVLKGYLKRLWLVLFDIHKYDFIFIHREAAPLGPPIFEWMITKVFRRKVIYDFDDAIWIPDTGSRIMRMMKAYWKVPAICKWSYKVVGGNDYLCSFARKYNPAVELIPTCVDVLNQHNRIKNQEESPLTIGWTGSHSTLRYLDEIVPVIRELALHYSFRFVVICNKPPAYSFPQLEFIQWSAKTEVDDLLRLHIGVMPLEQDPWSQGKCGFKLIQYLSLGIPAVASPVGVNEKIIEEGRNGFLCMKPDEWSAALEKLIQDHNLRKSMGENGRQKIEAEFSVQAYASSFLLLFS